MFNKNASPFGQLGQVLDQSLHQMLSDFVGNDQALNPVAANIIESDKGWTLHLAVPGYQKSELDIKIENQTLQVSGKVDKTEKAENEKTLRREFQISSFSRTFSLPITVDSALISAQYNNGVLEVHLPKKEQTAPENQSISIK